MEPGSEKLAILHRMLRAVALSAAEGFWVMAGCRNANGAAHCYGLYACYILRTQLADGEIQITTVAPAPYCMMGLKWHVRIM